VPLLADAVAKAARIAPTKGAAFDKAAGIMFEVYPDHAVVMATNLDTTYRQEVAAMNAVDIDAAEPARWRMSSILLPNLLAALPMGEGSTVRFVDQYDKSIRIMSGATIAKLALLVTDFPTIRKFDTAGMASANDLAARLASVSWAVDKKSDTCKGGIHVDGERLVATDGYKLAMIPCEAPVEAPVTVAAASLAHLLKSATDVRIRAEGTTLCMSLDGETQATTRIYGDAYPKYSVLFRDSFSGSVSVHRQTWIDVIQRMLTVIGNDKFPHLSLTMDGSMKKMILDIVAPTGDRIRDAVPFSGEFSGNVVLGCGPGMLLQGLQASNSESVTFDFGHEDPERVNKVTLNLSDPSGYQAFISAKIDVRAEKEV
jgi:DNA polymerase III sliding clamp (beta) subunit (PCNA family)